MRVAGTDALGWQRKAARRLRVSPPVVCGWANGDKSPGLATVVEIARLSGVCLNWLLLGEIPTPRVGSDSPAPESAP